MISEELVIQKRLDDLNKRGFTFHSFIYHLMVESKTYLFSKLGFNIKKFEYSHGKLVVTYFEIDLNYPYGVIDNIIIHVTIQNAYDSKFQLKSKIYNQDYELLATSISTYTANNVKRKFKEIDIADYFDIEKELTSHPQHPAQ